MKKGAPRQERAHLLGGRVWKRERWHCTLDQKVQVWLPQSGTEEESGVSSGRTTLRMWLKHKREPGCAGLRAGRCGREPPPHGGSAMVWVEEGQRQGELEGGNRC